MRKILLPSLLFVLSMYVSKSYAQIGMGTTTPDKSSVLDLTGTGKGFLVPRMAAPQRIAIATPAKGLLVFDNDSSYFFYYDGNAWKGLKNIPVQSPWHRNGKTVVLNAATDSVGIGKSPKYNLDIKNTVNVDSFYFIGGQRVLNIKGGQNLFVGQASGRNNSGSVNQFVGYQAGLSNTSGDSNFFTGYQSGYSNTTGSNNQFEGYKSGYSNTTASNDYFSGPAAGYSNTTGGFNHFAGIGAGTSNVAGSVNHFEGYHAGYSNQSGNSNFFTGFNAGYSNTSGNSNYFQGIGAGYGNTTANSNFFEGLQAGFSNTKGSQNMFIGHQAGATNTTSSNNQFIGYQAGNKNTSGANNFFIGFLAGYANTTASNNSFMGYLAGTKNTTGSSNLFNGYYTGFSNSTGSNNCYVGDSAGSGYNSTNNTFIGYHADAAGLGVNNATAIGSGATVSNGNTMAFGNANVTAWGFGIASPATGHALEVGASASNGNGAYLTIGGTWTNASDRNKKENFTPLDGKAVLDRIGKLQITRWNYKGETIATTHIGPMAQDFYKMFGTGNDSLAISTIDPAGVALIGVQELKKENEALKLQLESLQKEHAALKTAQNQKLDALSAEVSEMKKMLENKITIQTGNAMTITSQK
jgi:hypothetical protein